MTGQLKGKQKLPEHVVAPEGTSLFRTINFERYVVSSLPVIAITSVYLFC